MTKAGREASQAIASLFLDPRGGRHETPEPRGQSLLAPPGRPIRNRGFPGMLARRAPGRRFSSSGRPAGVTTSSSLASGQAASGAGTTRARQNELDITGFFQETSPQPERSLRDGGLFSRLGAPTGGAECSTADDGRTVQARARGGPLREPIGSFFIRATKDRDIGQDF